MIMTATGAGQRPGIEATNGAVAADAKIDCSAASGKKLHRNQRQNQRYAKHDGSL
jgi:hypothetical protein